MVEGEQQFEIREILDSRRYRGTLQHLVAWKDFPTAQNEYVDHCRVRASRLVKHFHNHYLDPNGGGAECHMRSRELQKVNVMGERYVGSGYKCYRVLARWDGGVERSGGVRQHPCGQLYGQMTTGALQPL